ncbi:MAG: hypothetical protein WA673_05245, partial [Candidatus Acidiferrales bacterium]
PSKCECKIAETRSAVSAGRRNSSGLARVAGALPAAIDSAPLKSTKPKSVSVQIMSLNYL